MKTKRVRPAGLFKTGHWDANHAEIAAALARLGPEPFDTTRVGGGFPDLIWPFQGQTVGFEVKRSDGSLTPAQERVFKEWRGGPLFLIRDAADLPEIIERIQRPTVRKPVLG
jgi:hypothetical protein